MTTLTTIAIPEFEIKCYLEHKWHLYISTKKLIESDILKHNCLEDTLENLGAEFNDLSPNKKNCVKKQITEIINKWYSNFQLIEGNWKYQIRKQSDG